MKKANQSKDDMRPEYDFASMKGGVRGKYVERLRRGSNIVVLDPEVAEAFPTGDSVNAAYFAAPGDVLVSGYLWEENRKQLAYKPLVAVQQYDRGVVIGFTADPTYRAYLNGMNLLLLNAVFRGPGHARPAPN
jgi:hypothetical protein